MNPAMLAGRGAFAFAGVASGLAVTNPWLALASTPDGTGADPGRDPGLVEIPAIGDAASIQWALGKKLGDTVDMTDERGARFGFGWWQGWRTRFFRGAC